MKIIRYIDKWNLSKTEKHVAENTVKEYLELCIEPILIEPGIEGDIKTNEEKIEALVAIISRLVDKVSADSSEAKDIIDGGLSRYEQVEEEDL